MNDPVLRGSHLSIAPPHWRWTQLSRIVQFRNGGDYKEVESEEPGYPVYGSGGQFRWANTWLHDGPSVLFGRKGTIDQPRYVEGKFWTVDTMFYTVPNESMVHPKFLYYWATRFPFGMYMSNTALPSMTQSDLGSEPLALPPVSEQRAIADYLDHETAEIDAFISDLQMMKSLMIERRESDRVWLLTDGSTDHEAGDRVPWADGLFTPHGVQNIRRVAEMKTGHTPNRGVRVYWTDTDIPWFTLADVWQLRAGSKYVSETNENISVMGLANSAAELLPKGTVMLSRTASVGFTGIMGRPMATSQDYWNWVCGPRILPEYLWHQFKAMSQKFSELMSGSTHKTIYQADAASLRIVVPPVERQNRILQKLRADDDDLAQLVSNANRAIDLARERRAALISAAVTGQIDVTKRHQPVAEVLEDEVRERV